MVILKLDTQGEVNQESKNDRKQVGGFSVPVNAFDK
jgi:hypothetical protein